MLDYKDKYKYTEFISILFPEIVYGNDGRINYHRVYIKYGILSLLIKSEIHTINSRVCFSEIPEKKPTGKKIGHTKPCPNSKSWS